MYFVIINIFLLILLIIFILTKRFWEKNTISLTLCILFIICMLQLLFPDDNLRNQILIIITTLVLNAAIITFLLAGKIAGTRFSQIVQDRNTAVLAAILSSVCFTIVCIANRKADIYVNAAIFGSFVMAPFVEEYGVRGIVFLKIRNQQKKWKRWVLYTIVSALFMSLHIVLQIHTTLQLFCIFLLSMACFAVRESWNSKYSFSVVWMMHMLHNAVPNYIVWYQQGLF